MENHHFDRPFSIAMLVYHSLPEGNWLTLHSTIYLAFYLTCHSWHSFWPLTWPAPSPLSCRMLQPLQHQQAPEVPWSKHGKYAVHLSHIGILLMILMHICIPINGLMIISFNGNIKYSLTMAHLISRVFKICRAILVETTNLNQTPVHPIWIKSHVMYSNHSSAWNVQLFWLNVSPIQFLIASWGEP